MEGVKKIKVPGPILLMSQGILVLEEDTGPMGEVPKVHARVVSDKKENP